MPGFLKIQSYIKMEAKYMLEIMTGFVLVLPPQMSRIQNTAKDGERGGRRGERRRTRRRRRA